VGKNEQTNVLFVVIIQGRYYKKKRDNQTIDYRVVCKLTCVGILPKAVSTSRNLH
jgi:hypothetical protein